jgi:2-methylcitrate dehydratase PrpD
MAGYDAAQRNSIFFDHGWHATSICGTLGAALAVAKLNGLSCEGMEHAVAIAASMCSGLLEANRAGGSVKRLHCGWAAQAGIVAADASCAGFTGPATIFEGRFGFYEAFCGGKFDAAAITQGLGEHWSIPEIFFKPYPANHFTHAGIDAALALRDKVSIDDIDSILLRVPQPTLLTVAEPHEVKISPQTGYQAQFSGPFTVATALLGGSGLGVGLDDFTDENARDARYRSLAAKVQCHSDAECDAVFPFEFPAKLLVRTRGGKELEHKIMRNRGGPGNPLTMDELRLKYMLNASRTLPDARATELAGAIARFEQWPIEDLMKLSTAQSAPTKHYAF